MSSRLATICILLLAGTTCAARWQPEFVADKWSGVHAIGGAGIYAVARIAGKPPASAAALSFAAGLAWEVGDAFKPRSGDFLAALTTSDGFSWSDLVYCGAGIYCAWLVDSGFAGADRLSLAPLDGGAIVSIGWRW